MSQQEGYKSKQPEVSEILEEIKSIDTSKYKSHPMVEKLLVVRVEELQQETNLLKQNNERYTQENSKLKIEVAVLNERKNSDKILGWIRNVTGIAMGISAGLIFSQEVTLS